MSRTLDVYFGEVKAGELVQDAGGSLAFAYASEYLATNNARAISVSMPLRKSLTRIGSHKPTSLGFCPMKTRVSVWLVYLAYLNPIHLDC